METLYPYPWKLIPAHIIAQVTVFVGTLLWFFDRSTGNFTGMTDAVYHVWLIMGFGAAPLMFVSYCVVFLNNGRWRYLAMGTHLVANIMMCTNVILWEIAIWDAGILALPQKGPGLMTAFHNELFFGFILICGNFVFGLWLITSDIVRLIRLEKMATSLMKSDSNE